MELDISYYGAPILRKKAQPIALIDDEIKALVVDMIDTMNINDGIGLAAPQVGKSLRLFITCVAQQDENGEYPEGEGVLRVYINPEILEYSDELAVFNEGCLSIPGLHGDVERPFRVKIKALDLDGNEFIHEADELEARCILHENDHLNGVLFIDRIRGKERQKLDPALKRIKSEYNS